MAEGEGDGLYCLCRRPYQESEFMIECDVCKDWFHGSCVGIEEHQSTDIDLYHCPNCQPEHGPLTLKRRRNWHRHDYSEINDGNKAVQSGTVLFIKKLKKKRFPNAGSEVLFRLKGSEVNLEYFQKHGFSKPLIVDMKDGLGIKVPPAEFNIADVERCVGSMRDLDVIDVSRQDDLRMKMREWTEYYEDRRARSKILNVISLEFSDTELAKLVSPPTVVRKIDWINNHWPDILPEGSSLSRPMVQKYCLMGVKDSYTDFHVDFGGTSVWYHVLWGEKLFYLIPPTEENLLRYEEWVSSSNQSEVFFGDMTSSCYLATIRAGNTFFIPAGWIHAVLTPIDSLVFGGNFLHRFAIRMQLRIYEVERRLNTPLKFRHPCYEALTWFAAQNYYKEVADDLEKDSEIPLYLLEGLEELHCCFTEWTTKREGMKSHLTQIPLSIQPSKLIEQLAKVLERASTKMSQRLPLISDSERHRRGSALTHGGRHKRLSPGTVEQVSNEKKRRAITTNQAMNEIKASSNDKKVALKFVVPDEEEIMKESSGSEGSLHIQDETTPSPTPDEDDDIEHMTLQRVKDEVLDWKEYKDNDYVYPDLVEEGSDLEIGCGDREGPGGRKKTSYNHDEMWMPQGGSVHLMGGSIASSFRERRNAKKRSFEQSLSATAAKILRMEQERGEKEDKIMCDSPAPSQVVNRNRQVEPVVGGGALKVKGHQWEGAKNNGDAEEKNQRARAAAAANAVDAVVAASRPKAKLLTPKQRLSKILGLGKANRRKV